MVLQLTGRHGSLGDYFEEQMDVQMVSGDSPRVAAVIIIAPTRVTR